MALVTVTKDGQFIDVDEQCVVSHQEAGWRVATASQINLAAAVGALPDVQAQIDTLAAKVAKLEEDVELASVDAPASTDPTFAAIQARIAELQAKKEAGLMERQDYPLLARLLKQLPPSA